MDEKGKVAPIPFDFLTNGALYTIFLVFFFPMDAVAGQFWISDNNSKRSRTAGRGRRKEKESSSIIQGRTEKYVAAFRVRLFFFCVIEGKVCGNQQFFPLFFSFFFFFF